MTSPSFPSRRHALIGGACALSFEVTGASAQNTDSAGVPIRLDREVLSTTKRSVVQVFTDNASGSGFIVKTGSVNYCMTNLHVVSGAIQVQSRADASRTGDVSVRTAFGSIHRAQVWKYHVGYDIALLRIYDQIPEIVAADVAQVLPIPGQPIFVWGAPYGEALVPIDGLVQSVEIGSVSLDKDSTQAHLIRMRVGAQPGNSGGPVHTTDGRVIGIVTRRNENQGVSEGTSIAVSTTVFWSAMRGFIDADK